MIILTTSGWSDYQLLDSGNGRRLEKFGAYILNRPDPQCLWEPFLPVSEWEKVDAIFSGKNDKGKWEKTKFIPDAWKMHYKSLSFYLKLSPFKHTGVFPEQHLHWEWMIEILQRAKNRRKKEDSNIKVLNLFGYTGIASLICAANGAEVTHVDASYPTIGWARENQSLSKLEYAPIRWILDDCLKFVKREARREVKYDAIIMDPPVFGHGPKGERWEFNESFPELMSACQQVLSDQPVFILINAYAVSASSIMLQNMLEDIMRQFSGKIDTGELALEEMKRKRLLSTGIFARWSK